MLERLSDEALGVSLHVACELYAGAELADAADAERAKVETLLAALDVVQPDDLFPQRYGRVLAELRRRGQTISTMDLLIAATALGVDAALVTRNTRDFERVPGLRVIGY